jgi:nucleolar MIF4G domain-containing protein 1
MSLEYKVRLYCTNRITATNATKDVVSGRYKRRSAAPTRKETRKAERRQSKAVRNGPPPQKRLKSQHARDPDVPDEVPTTAQTHPRSEPLRAVPESTSTKQKSSLKRASEAEVDTTDSSTILPPMKISRSVRDKLAADDEEIATLERKLGLKGKKALPQSFKEDGLDELLEGLGEEEDTDAHLVRKRKAEGDEWLDRKRRQARLARRQDVSADEESENQSDVVGSEDIDEDDGASHTSLDDPGFADDISDDDLGGLTNFETFYVEDDFEGFDSDKDGSKGSTAPSARPRIRENPYVAPTSGAVVAPVKYIPPALRKQTSDSEILIRLRRQAQGLVNRLTEANLISILGEIERLYRENARHHVTTTLVDLLLTSVCEPTALPDTLIILPAGFIAAIYKIIGTDFGALVIQRIVELFTEHYQQAADLSKEGSAPYASDISKETSNLVMLLSELFNFQVVGSNLIFDYIRLLLGKRTELNAELLLKIIRTSGPQLRQDDPSALKDIVALLRPSVASMGEENISVRMKFMIETINDLKNNKMKTGNAASAVTSEHTIRMKKILGSLNARNIKGSEPMRISLKDIQESEKKGKWWLVGASWSGPGGEEADDSTVLLPPVSDRPPVDDLSTADLSQLAREQRMNTDVRRAIFVAIMSASDYQDAYLRMMKLQLKKKQEFEIPKVLIHCAGAEKSYNPYYTLIAKRLCGDTKLKKSFQFSLWDIFKKMGESEDNDGIQEDEEEDSLDTRHIVNLAKMFGTLIVEGGLSLGVLKNLNLTYLQPKTKTFVEVLFITIILQSQRQSEANRDEKAVVNTFLKIKDVPELIRGVQYFLKKVVSKTDIAGGKEQKATVKWACKVAAGVLEALVAVDATDN